MNGAPLTALLVVVLAVCLVALVVVAQPPSDRSRRAVTIEPSASPSHTPAATSMPLTERRAALEAACRWAPAFGGVAPERLAGFDLAVLDLVATREGHRDTEPADVVRLQREGTLVLAYLSIGTAEDWRHYAPAVAEEWNLGPVDGWPGEQYVDTRRPGWQELMVREAQDLAALGVDGLYLDNLDAAQDFPQTANGFVELVEHLRAATPDLLLVAQNGLVVADRLPIDALAHEDVFWRWDDGYRASTAAELDGLLPRLRVLRQGGLPIFTVEYAEPGSSGALEAFAASQDEGFRPAVTILALDEPPHLAPPACR